MGKTVVLQDGHFEWDEVKSVKNAIKHRISFEEARTAFYDKNAIVIDDPDHSTLEEARFILLGFSLKARLLVVCHCYRENDEVVRIISARKANRRESKIYRDRY